MTRIAKWVVLTFVLAAFSITRVHAQTINAASCSSVDVQAALNTVAVDGTTVVIPSCPTGVVWATNGPAPVTYNQVYSTTIQGQTTISCTGTPGARGYSCDAKDATVIIDNVNHNSNGDEGDIMVNTAKGKSFRISGITFAQNASSVTTNHGVLQVGGQSTSVRVDHIHCNMVNESCLGMNQITGVADHNIFDQLSASEWNAIRVNNASWKGVGGEGDNSWADTTQLGTSSFVYMEANIFNNGVADDCVTGGRMVFRFNQFNDAATQTHPTGSQGRARGCRAWEIYQNTFTNLPGFCAAHFGQCYNNFFMSSGTGVIWGNNPDPTEAHFVTMQAMRTTTATYNQSATPAGWGYCGRQVNGTGSGWDQNSDPILGYACIDQPGRGVGDLLSGQFPNVCNQTLGCKNYDGQWPRQALEPVYEWLQNYSGNFATSYWGVVTGDLTQNRDYYLYQTTGCNGTQSTGVCSGSLADRASNCTPGVAYWATDQGNWNQSGNGVQGQLYVCTATNAWTLYYTPYTYPHPLAQGTSTSGSVAPPKNLTAIVQ